MRKSSFNSTVYCLLSTVYLIIFLFGCAAPEKKIEETIFYPPLPEQPRLQFLTSITSEEDIGKKQSALMEFLIGELPPTKKIEMPYDVGAAKGKIYISDRKHKKILIIDLLNKVFDFIKSQKEGSISEPAGIWITEDDYKYLADFGRKQILVFDNNNNFVRAYGEKDQFDKPLDVAVYENKIYVCDFNKHQILVLNKDSGNIVQTIGESGMEEGKFYKPTHIIVDKEGNLFVNDSFNFRIQKFDSNGNFLKTIGYHGDTIGGFARPKGITIDKENYLYTVDAAFENVQIFDANTAEVLLFFGGFGPEQPGTMYLPSGIFIDYNNIGYFKKYTDKDFRLKYLVFVSNMLGKKKLNVYGFGEWIGAPLPDMPKK
ncbi:hypothetical protein HZA26_03175 [Candidatus Nomurabacteria bacterium]|nr:hypothetical protein [Candidatus Nomurabacteria bacterium]